jgi:hypothetical protein
MEEEEVVVVRLPMLNPITQALQQQQQQQPLLKAAP